MIKFIGIVLAGPNAISHAFFTFNSSNRSRSGFLFVRTVAFGLLRCSVIESVLKPAGRVIPPSPKP